jgi:hypothetical protein
VPGVALQKRAWCLQRVSLWPLFEKAEIPWIQKLMGDFPESSLLYEPFADPDGSQLRRVREHFPEAKIWGWPGQSNEALPEGIEPLKRHVHIDERTS